MQKGGGEIHPIWTYLFESEAPRPQASASRQGSIILYIVLLAPPPQTFYVKLFLWVDKFKFTFAL